jgi:MFS transporter, putative metabolite:H+ symporter
MTQIGVTIATRMDRLPITRTHRWATAVVGLGLFFEFYEVFLAGVLGTVLVQEFHLSESAVPALLASTFVGMFLGALLLGRLADRLGRRRALLLTLACYSAFSLLGAFSPGPATLLITRFFAGLGLGAEPPLADTYLTDLLPAARRGRFIAAAYTLAFCGVPVVGFLARGIADITILGVAGWRWMFAFGALGAVLVFALRRGLPESPRWLQTVGRGKEAEELVSALEAEARASGHELAPAARGAPEPRTADPRALLRPPHARRTLMMAVFHPLQALGYYGFGTLVPLVLITRGYEVNESLLFTALTYVGYPVGSALALPLVERIERKLLVVATLFAMVGFGLGFGYAGSMTLVLAFGALFTATSNIFSNAYHVYQAEIFPTALRATAASSTYSLSRLATAAMPFLLIPLLHHAGADLVFLTIALALAAAAIDIAVLGPRTTGRTLDTVNTATPAMPPPHVTPAEARAHDRRSP